MIQVEPGQDECFYEHIKKGQPVDMSLMVLRGGLLDINLNVYRPDGTVLSQKKIISNVNDETGQVQEDILVKGHQFITAEDGEFKFCFDNTMSRWTAKVVAFSLFLGDEGTTIATDSVEEENVAKKAHITPVENSIERLKVNLESIHKEQLYYRNRETAHRDTAESSNTRVAWFTVFESLTIIGVSVGQLVMVRKWFSKDLGRQWA